MRGVLDSAALWPVLVHWRALRRATRLVLYANGQPSWIRLTTLRVLCRLLVGRTLEVRVVRKDKLYATNPEAVRRIEAHPEAFNADLISALAAFVSAPHTEVVKYAKSGIIHRLAAKLLVRAALHGDDVRTVIATDDDRFAIYTGVAATRSANGTRVLRWRIAKLATAIAGASAVVVHLLLRTKFRLRRPAALKTDLIAQVNYFGDTNLRTFTTEDYVFDPARVALLITDAWRPASDEQLRHYTGRLRRRGIRFADVRDFAVDPLLFVRLAASAARLVRSTWRVLRTWDDVAVMLRFLKAVLREELFLAHCDVRAMLCMDDYMPYHIVRTLVCRTRGVRVFGIQHSAGNGLHGVPNLAYVCFDRYLVFGRFFRRLFHPFWEDVPLVEFSYNRIDAQLRSGHQRRDRRSRAQGRRRILITLPITNGDHAFSTLYPNYSGMLDFLGDVGVEIPARADVLVRPKVTEGLTELRARIGNGPVKLLMEDAGSTPDLLADADLVIASNGSGIIAECALLRVPVVTYDYLGFLRHHWIGYGRDMCLSSADEVRACLLAFVRGEALDVDWERLWADMAYPNQGDTHRILERLLDERTEPEPRALAYAR